MKPSRLHGRKVNDYLRRKGMVWRGKTMTIIWLRGAPKNTASTKATSAVFLGSAASVKLHKSAVQRNRMRRRCREAMRTSLLQKDTMPTVQILIHPRITSLTCDFVDIQKDVDTFLGKI